ncbi:hypothetical protein D0T84_19780, partial [Dysgonomonas sp. 521]|uniref:FISUMP domain-containing protein n=1 Tax=Dysgonomonas sp. 521 TaxID=2302932 RepID=UPI001C8839AC
DLALEEDELGNRKKTVSIACRMEIGGKTVQSTNYDVLVVKADKDKLSPIYVKAWNGTAMENGEGDPATDMVTIAFAHVNLGAIGDTDPCGCMGGWYQWGRETDGDGITTGHFRRNLTDGDAFPEGIGLNPVEDLPEVSINDYDDNGQIKPIVIDKYGKFIKARVWNPYIDLSFDLWGDGTYNLDQARGKSDPCPTGWKIPSSKQWNSIFGIIEKGEFFDSSATANRWTWIDNKHETDDRLGGYKIADILYLPIAGYRRYYDALPEGEGSGHYWSSTIANPAHTAYHISIYDKLFHSSYNVNMGTQTLIGEGLSVRCIKDEDPPYTPPTPSSSATVTACASPTDETLGTDGYADGYKIGLRAVEASTGFYMFTYQTMRLYANYSDTPEPTSYQWVVDGKANKRSK